MAATFDKTDTPGVYRRGSRFCVVFYDHEGRQRKRTAPTYTKAKKLKAALTADVARGEYTELKRVRFIDYAREWIDHYQGRTKAIREETRNDYRKALERHAIPFFGRRLLSSITTADVKALAHAIAATGVAPATVRLQLAPVKALFATAVEEGLLRSNPALRVTIRQPERLTDEGEVDEQVKALSEGELRKVIEKLPEQWWLFFTLLAQTGLRIGEAIALRWGDVDFTKRMLTIRRRYYRGRFAPPKSRHGRRDVRLTKATARALSALWNESRPDAAELVFPNANGGVLDQSNLMSRVLKPAAVEAGLGAWVVRNNRRTADSWVGFHTFRHTCATTLFRHGWNAVQVQKALGHHSPAFTLSVYVHLLTEDLPEASFLDDVVGMPVGMRPPETAGEPAPTEATQESLETPPVAGNSLPPAPATSPAAINF
jgi:integrase